VKVVLALLLALTNFAAAAQQPNASTLFAAQLRDLDGKTVTLADYRGKPLVVNFWARWCEPCRGEIPSLVSERARFKDRGVEVIGIAIENEPEAVRDFARAYGIDYPVLLAMDQGIELMQALGNAKAGLPYTLVLDRRGQVVARRMGSLKQDDMAAAFEAALK
jgi:peroxiredoxin